VADQVNYFYIVTKNLPRRTCATALVILRYHPSSCAKSQDPETTIAFFWIPRPGAE